QVARRAGRLIVPAWRLRFASKYGRLEPKPPFADWAAVTEECGMKTIFACAVLALGIALSTAAADAKGCIKGAVVGGVAGHYTVHHGVIGAAVGCYIGHREAKRAARQKELQRHQPQQTQPQPQ